jgi:hypothetical protein
MILVFFVPAVVVSGVLLVWQLYSRRERVDSDRPIRKSQESIGSGLAF